MNLRSLRTGIALSALIMMPLQGGAEGWSLEQSLELPSVDYKIQILQRVTEYAQSVADGIEVIDFRLRLESLTDGETLINDALIPAQHGPYLIEPELKLSADGKGWQLNYHRWAGAGTWVTTRVEFGFGLDAPCFGLERYRESHFHRVTHRTHKIERNYKQGINARYRLDEDGNRLLVDKVAISRNKPCIANLVPAEWTTAP